jgi:hypothetical protein
MLAKNSMRGFLFDSVLMDSRTRGPASQSSGIPVSGTHKQIAPRIGEVGRVAVAGAEIDLEAVVLEVTVAVDRVAGIDRLRESLGGALPMRMPLPRLKAMTFPAPAVPPPIRFPIGLSVTKSPCRVLLSAAVPVVSVLIRFPRN